MKNFYILILYFVISIFSLEGVRANNTNTNIDSTEAKDKILKEFREKLLNEQEIKKELEKNVTLTNEDFDVLIKKDDKTTIKDVLNAIKKTDEEKKQKEEEKAKKKEEERIKKERQKQVEEEEKKIKKEQERIEKEEEKIRKEEDRIKKEEAKNLKIKQSEAEKEKKKKEKEEFEKRKKELNKKKKELEKNNENITKLKESINNIGDSISDNIKNVSKNFNSSTNTQQANKKPGVLVKVYNITDTGVSEEFLYTKKYQELINNKTTIKKVDINKETDIPILYVEEKNIINFNTSDIPEELLTYKRSEENKHIPTIILNKDLQNIAIKAIEQNNLSVLRGVIEQTKDPDFFIDKNRTLLAFAIESQKYILVRYLIYSGASINKTDNKLNNPLHISILNHNEEIVNLLIENGVNIDAQNIDGDTPLMLSISTNQDNIALILLKNGANLKLKNNAGDTAIDVCTKNGKTKIRQYIRDIMKEEENL